MQRLGSCLAILFFLRLVAPAQEPLRIGTITVQALDVFAPEEAARGWVYRAANSLHVTTHEQVIRRFLLFEEGDPYDPELLAEAERNLRELRFVKSASVLAGLPHDGVVDVAVVTQDAWTLQIGLSLGSVGGSMVGGFSLGERDLLGSGREVSLGFKQDTERTLRSVEVRDPTLFAQYGVGHLLYASNSDGTAKVLEYQRPFYSALAPWALAVAVQDTRQRNSLWAGGEEASVYSHQVRQLFASYALAVHATSKEALRLGAGLDWHDDVFAAYPGHEADERPSGRRFRYFFVEGEAVRNDLVKLNYVNRDLRFEDFNLGRRVAIRFGVSPAAFGSQRTAEMARLSWDEGWRVGSQSLLLAGVSGETRLESGRATNAILSGRLLYVRRFAAALPQTFVSRLEVTRAWNLDPDVQFFADGSTGLRAYRLHAFEGDKRILLNAEYRVFAGQEVLQLVAPGLAVFFDAGAIAPRGVGLRLAQVRADAGVGLRFAITRAASVPIIRVDAACAFQPDPRGRRGWLISFSGGQAF